MMGGEITWECSGGNYIFSLKVYRDCRGVSFSNTTQQIDVTGHPTITFISCAPYTLTDLSAPNCGYSCADANPPQGATEEYVFKSAPISLGNFTPPAGGWIFTWNLCCRNSTILNIANPGGLGMTLRAKMFSYNGLPATPCYNSSPGIAERPLEHFCSGYYYQYAQTAFDKELDSLHYEWDLPADGSAPGLSYIPYISPYSLTNPYPGYVGLDPNTGLVSYSSAIGIQGDYVSCIRIDEYRCGVKVSETFRDIQFNVSNVCPPVYGGNINFPPYAVISGGSPFISYFDTVFAGENVSLQFMVIDTNWNDGQVPTLQQITFNGISPQFGTNDTSTTGCLIPPCATLSHPSPTTFLVGEFFAFNWQTSCNHVSSFFDCYQNKSVYQFVLRATDDYCPAPAVNNYLITIVVNGPEITVNGDTLFCNFPGTDFIWYLDGIQIPGANTSYLVTTTNGIYSVSTVIPGECRLFAPPVPVYVAGMENESLLLFNAEVIPNPTSGLFSINFQSLYNRNGFILITDPSGRKVRQLDQQFMQGENSIPVDLSVFDAGVYLLHLRTGNTSLYRKIVVN
jgi:Secretion system C-terminal sorting domain